MAPLSGWPSTLMVLHSGVVTANVTAASDQAPRNLPPAASRTGKRGRHDGGEHAAMVDTDEERARRLDLCQCVGGDDQRPLLRQALVQFTDGFALMGTNPVGWPIKHHPHRIVDQPSRQ